MKLTLKNMVDGNLQDITECSDEIFAEKVLGDGIMISPKNNKIIAPFSGIIETVTNTKHAITMSSDEGIPVIIHVGIDTVELNGEGFHSLVKNGDKIVEGQELLEVDFSFIEQQKYDTSVLMIVLDKEAKIEKMNIGSAVNGSTAVMEISK